jgi:hypothetical protein
MNWLGSVQYPPFGAVSTRSLDDLDLRHKDHSVCSAAGRARQRRGRQSRPVRLFPVADHRFAWARI